ncbi:MAG: radical SAM protein, partial [Pseudomonadota bacterium]
LESLLNDFQPEIVGATCVTMNFYDAVRVIEDVKSISPHVFTVIGGCHISFCARETLEQFPCLDCAVLGEGEDTVVELVRAIEQGRDLGHIKGLAYRKNGRVVLNEPRLPGIDLDTLPLPARHLLPLGRYKALGLSLTMTTSRGCPHQCIFCVGRKMIGPKVRYRRPEAVVDELEYLTSLGFPQVNIADDLFTADKRRCLAICDEILRRGLTTKWTSFSRVDTVSPEVLGRMREAGCSAISFGVESGNAGILKTIKKRITTDQVVTAVKMCTAAGILPHASFILGLPGETPETIEESVAFGKKLKELGVSYGFHLLAPFPGTRVRDNAEEYGLKILTNDWSEYHANRAIVETATVTAAMLDEVVADWQRQFDLYLEYIKGLMKSGQATEEEAWPLVNLERTVLLYDLLMNRVIEGQGTWPTSGRLISEEEALDSLIDRVSAWAGKPRSLVSDTLKNSVSRNHLNCRQENGQVHWEWRDYL